MNLPSFFPSAFYAGLVRLDTPACNPGFVYAADKKRFAQNRKRKMFIRSIWPGEFGTSAVYPCNIPQIHVWVKKFRPGMHEVIPVWVGTHHFNSSVTTDDEVLTIIAEMQRLGGIDSAYWDAFNKSLHEYMNTTRIEAIQ